MSEKLYRVDWSGECYVWAKSEREAEQAVLDEVGYAEEKGILADATAVDKNDVPDPEWLPAVPYRSPDDRTVGEIIEAMEADDAE